jgi:acyl-CoA thioesterase YciA
VYVGDCLLCYATVERIGRTSITIHVKAHAERVRGGEDVAVTEGRFTLVALDADRNPVAIQG